MKKVKKYLKEKQEPPAFEIMRDDVLIQDLKKPEDIFQNVIINTKEPIFIVGFDGKFKFISPQYIELMGGIKIDLDTNIFKYIHSDDVNMLVSLFKKGIAEKEPVINENIEFRLKQKNNQYIWVSSSTKNYYNSDGKLSGFISTLRDVTEQKLNKKKLEESIEKFKSIIEQTPIEIYILQDGQIKYTNKRDLTFSEYSVKEVLKWSEADIMKIIHPEDLNFILDQERMNTKEEKNEIPSYNFRIITKSGKMMWIESKFKKIIYHGNPARLITLKESSEQKKTKISTKEFKEKEELALNYFEDIKESLNGLCLLLNMAYNHDDIYLWTGIENLNKLYQRFTQLFLDEDGINLIKQKIEKTKIDLDISENDEVYFKFS
ncbi:MAG: PAS domain-containing protein [Candidatus Hermodarchaeota archaeon]